ncbi:phospholipid scramblase 2-like [Mytilus galloprovincialis]|uniref:phospholipid scramblase 2-like n=1 Tax=Mytilus galloprovincialis TaxID=29158 RepID=UPI003F7C771B
MTAVTTQPGDEKQLPQLPPITELPPGLKELQNITEIKIHQHLDSTEVFCCWQRPARYSLYDGTKEEEHFLYAQEVSECYVRQCLGANRGFVMKLSNADQQEVLRLQRPLRCPCGVCWWWCCCIQELNIESPPGTHIATISEDRSFCCCPGYYITSEDDRILFRISFSCFLCKLCASVSIQITERGEPVAEITKNCSGNCKDFCGTENEYTIKFLKDLHVQDKIIILGSSFLIDYNFFERQQRTCC